MKKVTINWDLDGTLADLYNYPNWLEMLRNQDSPFERLGLLPLGEEIDDFIKKINALGYNVVHRVITWLPIQDLRKSKDYDFLATCASDKESWVFENISNLLEVICLPYGTPKQSVCKGGRHILVDDNYDVLASFQTGKTRLTVEANQDNPIIVLHDLMNAVRQLS